MNTKALFLSAASAVTLLGAASPAHASEENIECRFDLTGKTFRCGNFSQADAEAATAIGLSAKATGVGATVLGNNAEATDEMATAIGSNAEAKGSRSTAIGQAAQAAGTESTAIGQFSEAKAQATALGKSARALANGTASGFEAYAGTQAVGVGFKAYANTTGVAIGGLANADDSAVAIGSKAYAASFGAVAIGNQAAIGGPRAVAMGNKALAGGMGSVAVGDGTKANDDYASSLLGTATGKRSTAVGFEATTNAENASAFGARALAEGANSTAIGFGSIAKGENEVALGGANSFVRVGDIAASSARQAGGTLRLATFDAEGVIGWSELTLQQVLDDIAAGGGADNPPFDPSPINDKNDQQDDAIKDAQDKNDQQDGAIKDVQDKNDQQDGAIKVVSDKNDAQDKVLDSHETRIDQLEVLNTGAQQSQQEMVKMQQTLQGHGAAISDLQGKVGTLFDLVAHNRRQARAANAGVALALAMDTPVVMPDEKMALTGGFGMWNGKVGGSASIAYRVGRRAAVSAGVGVASTGKVGGRLGFRLGW